MTRESAAHGGFWFPESHLVMSWEPESVLDSPLSGTIGSLRSTRDPSIQDRIEQAFRAEWCHLGIFGVDCVTIVWCFLPPLYFLDFFNV